MGKFHYHGKFGNAELFLLMKQSQKKSISTNIANEMKQNKSASKVGNKKKVSCTVPYLGLERISEINTITGICLGKSYISWVKCLVPTLTVLDWNAKVIPEDFRYQKDEPSILKLAYDVKHSLPNSDLYVMETFSMRGKELFEKVNFIHLSSMLTVLLNGLQTDLSWKEKVIFQQKFVLNNLHNLLVGSERISTRYIVEDILFNLFQPHNKHACGKKSDIYSSIKIHSKYFNMYKESVLEKKEDLSLVLLLTLSFIDISIFQNENSLNKIYEKKVYKLK